MAACLFATDVITKILSAGKDQAAILSCDCAKDVHKLFQHLVTQMFSVLYTRWREKENEGNFGPLRSFYSLCGVKKHPPDLRIKKQ